MGSRRQEVRVTRLGRFLRGWRPDRNPLRRASDRAETAVLALLVIAFLAAAPFVALASGGYAYSKAHHAQLTQEASWRQVPALVLSVSSGGGGYADPDAQAQARWTAPDGKVITGGIPVPIGTVAGATVPLWVANDGQLTDQPLTDAQVSDSRYFAGTFGVITLATVLAITGFLARRELNKRRMAAWDTDWRATGPRWTTRA
jgi:hypothetical protein